MDTERFWTAVYGKFSEEAEDKMATIAQQLEKRGFEKGKQEGLEKVARKLKKNRRDLNENDLIKWVKEMTGLSEKKIKEL